MIDEHRPPDPALPAPASGAPLALGLVVSTPGVELVLLDHTAPIALAGELLAAHPHRGAHDVRVVRVALHPVSAPREHRQRTHRLLPSLSWKACP